MQLDKYQNKVVNEDWDANLRVIGAPGSGKCVVGDSLVLTRDGLIEISECKPGMKVADHNMDMSIATHLHNLGVSETVKIVTTQGYEIEGTPEHPIRILENGQLVWKRLSDVTDDDNIALSFNTSYFGSNEDFLDSCDPYIIGMLIADGNVGKRGQQRGYPLSLSRSGEMSIPFIEWAERNFSAKVYSRTKLDSLGETHQFNSKEAIEYLTAIDYPVGCIASEKYVPRSILRGSEKVQRLFLMGYFDLESHCNPTRGIEVVTASEKMSRQIQVMLLNFGIISKRSIKKVKGYEQDYYRITISGTSAEMFGSKIGYANATKKQEKLDELLLLERNTNIDVFPLPKSFYDDVRAEAKRLNIYSVDRNRKPIISGELFTQYSRYSNQSRRISRKKLSSLSNSVNNKLGQFLSENIFIDKPKDIFHSENRVYDFTVCESHSYIANCFINHNTRTLTMRYANLYINGGIKPSRILVQTFSRKTAAEMSKRIGLTVDLSDKAKQNISTINAFCYRLYNDWRKGIGMDPLKVWQYGDRAINPSYKAAELMQEWLHTSDLSLFDEINKTLKSDPEPTYELLREKLGQHKAVSAYKMWVEYEKWMKDNNLTDFYGQVWNVDRLLHKNPVFAMMTGKKFDKILTDECQDMFPQTYRILLKLAGFSSIELYGDPSQSIYGFNGANPKLFYEVEDSIDGLVTYHLANNYRSANRIVKAVNNFGPNTSDRFEAMNCINFNKPGKVQISGVNTLADQADLIAEEIRAKEMNYGDVAVLARTNAHCSVIFGRLMQLGIPANYTNKFSIWDKTHIKAGIGYMAIANEQDSPEDLESILNIPSENHVNTYGPAKGRYSPSRYLAKKDFIGVSAKQILSGEVKHRTRGQIPGIKNIVRFLGDLKPLDNRQKMGDIGAAISKWAQWNGIDTFQVEDDLAMLWDKLENMDFDINKLKSYIQKMKELRKSIKPGSNKVEVMTIHQAKGLEYENLFVTGLCEPEAGQEMGSGFYPGRNTNPNINEENCLYYVAISRAIERLYLLYYKRGSKNVIYELSSFVTDFTKSISEGVINQNGKI